MGFLIHTLLKAKCRQFDKTEQARIRSQQPPSGVQSKTDLAYCGDGHPLHLLDVHIPEETQFGAGPFPVLFCIHGGGWVYGTKELISYYAMDMCTRGFAVINLSYRLLPEVGLYEQLSDIFRAYCYAEKLPDTSLRSKMDFTRVYLAGDSAGGYFAMYTAALISAPETVHSLDFALPRFVPRAVIASSPVCDLDFLTGRGNPMRRLLLGAKPQSSPLLQKHSVKQLLSDCSLPPVLFTGFAGDREFGAQGAMLHEVLQNANIPHDFLCFDGPEGLQMGHTYNVSYFDQPRAQEINRTCAEFLLSH